MQAIQISLATSLSPQRFSLSTRGYATAALCPRPDYTTDCDGRWDRATSERAQWAYAHGLEPLDGAYLRELIDRPLTLSQLGEALAILSQTSQMVTQTMEQLGSLGLIEPMSDEVGGRSGPPDDDIRAELSAALSDLHRVLASVEGDAQDGQRVARTASVTVRRAMSRVIAARCLASAGGSDSLVDAGCVS